MFLPAGLIAFVVDPGSVPADPPKSVPEHPLRRRLLDLIRDRPGVRLSTLWRAIDVSRGTAQYHLEVLERTRKVEARRESKNLTRYFPPGIEPRELVLLSILRRGRVLEFLREIGEQPGVTQTDLGKRLLTTRRILRRYADLLVQEELLYEVREAKVKRYFLTPHVRQLLDRLDETQAGAASERVRP